MKKSKRLMSALLAGCLAASAVPAALATASDRVDDNAIEGDYAVVKCTWYNEAGEKGIYAYSYDDHAKLMKVACDNGAVSNMSHSYDRFGRVLEFKDMYTDENGVTNLEDWERTQYAEDSTDYSYQILDENGLVSSTLYYTRRENTDTYETYAGDTKETILEKTVFTYNEDNVEEYWEKDGAWYSTTVYTLDIADGMLYEIQNTTYANGEKSARTYRWIEETELYKGYTDYDADGNVILNVEYKYDANGNIIQGADDDGNVYTYIYEYDADGNPTSSTEYNAAGEMTWQGYFDENGLTVKAFCAFENGKAVEDRDAYYYEFISIDEILAGYAGEKFSDVKPEDYFAAPVVWAVNKGITNGTTADTFSPTDDCTRAQIVTMLWREAQEPTPSMTENPFTDVPDDAYYKTAVLWAVENGITNGMSDTTFAPEASCTRAQAATFLWRVNGEPEPQSTENPFADITGTPYYKTAVLWAVENGITNGTSDTTFEPDTTCAREHIVTFLYRAVA